MLSYDFRNNTEIRAIGTQIPMVPTWAAYYDFENSKVTTKQVVCFSVREHLHLGGPITTQVKLYPIVLDKETGEMVEEDGTTTGYLGLVEEADPKDKSLSALNEKVREMKKRMKGSKATASE